jgi:Type II CAAX prenyl endopeptidase Rce1-like
MSHLEPRSELSQARDLIEIIVGFGIIMTAIWLPEYPQHILTPIAFLVSLEELGIGGRGLAASFWILPAAILLSIVSVLIAKRLGTLHPLYSGDATHIVGYVLWTLYQQFLMNDLFMPRLVRVLGGEAAAVTVSGVLFAAAHLPNLWLTAATVVWGVVSCSLFLRYRNLYALGLAQGLLGLCFAICIPDALHHHLRVGLGYLRYHATE